MTHPLPDDIHDYHRTLLDALVPINGPLEMSQWASEEFARLCKSTGKPVCALTIEDLTRAMHCLHTSYGRGLGPVHQEISQ